MRKEQYSREDEMRNEECRAVKAREMGIFNALLNKRLIERNISTFPCR